MNLQCPSCLKPLTVPDQYAGQMMKCPLCASTFSVPAQGGDAEPLPELPALPPPTSTPTTPTLPVSTPTPTSNPTPSSSNVPTLTPASTTPPTTPTSARPASSTRSTSDGGYTQSCTLFFRAKVMQWIAPVAVVLIFVLQFFPWVGVYPGGVMMISQGAWGAAFGAYDQDNDMMKDPELPESERPGASALLVFYLLLFLPTLLLTVGAVLIDTGIVSAQTLPPNLQGLLRWRWAAVAALNLLVFLFLFLQTLLGFSVESKIVEKAREQLKTAGKTTADTKQAQAKYGMLVQNVSRTFYLTLVFWLHVLAVIGAWTTYCIHDRGGKPDPKLELVW